MNTSPLQRAALLLLLLLLLLASALTVWSLRRGGDAPSTALSRATATATAPAAVVSVKPDVDPEGVGPVLETEVMTPPPLAEQTTESRVERASEPSLTPATPSVDAASTTAEVLTFTELVTGALPTLNPLLTTDPATRALADKLYLPLVGQDAQSGQVTPTGLAEGWRVSAASDVFTFTLRSDLLWSDGVPVVADDVVFTFDALIDEEVDSPYRTALGGLSDVNAVDERTVVVTLAQPDCSALATLHQPILPSHRYTADFSDLRNSPANAAPVTSAGPFRFVEQRDDGTIVLAANPAYWRGEPIIERYLLASGAGQPGVRTDMQRLSSPANSPSATMAQTIYPADRYSFIALNLADPAQPRPGQGADGNAQAQEPHPILGEVRVRQALAAALDYDALLAVAYDGPTYRTGTYVPPAAQWAHDATLAPYAYDPTRATQLLNEAGWRDQNGDGVRTREGVPLELTLLTNNDSTPRMAIAELAAEQLDAVGFRIRRNALPFPAMTEQLLAQTFDLAVLSWDNLSADPGAMPFWHSREDEPGSGFNFVSYQDREVDAWLDQARRAPGCDPALRAERYRQVQARIYDAVPYVIIGGPQAAWLYNRAWTGIAPGPWHADDNIEQWRPE
jgi:peptide/nickel transport system substrate-binding protein